ncbi:hypothetical protein INQ51_17785 [Maribellus sp. CM-23]|uniref:hypothetical protein n=1 Tax=Maribellus sp. CM-23 TaxID=2781026 RepID=UPI001F3E665E|nr:hypothetical protein [Maribellus sp. CM-23]MCE4566176.1 hypothetical protein [Maribellus sp. CM-23]
MEIHFAPVKIVFAQPTKDLAQTTVHFARLTEDLARPKTDSASGAISSAQLPTDSASGEERFRRPTEGIRSSTEASAPMKMCPARPTGSSALLFSVCSAIWQLDERMMMNDLRLQKNEESDQYLVSVDSKAIWQFNS